MKKTRDRPRGRKRPRWRWRQQLLDEFVASIKGIVDRIGKACHPLLDLALGQSGIAENQAAPGQPRAWGFRGSCRGKGIDADPPPAGQHLKGRSIGDTRWQMPKEVLPRGLAADGDVAEMATQGRQQTVTVVAVMGSDSTDMRGIAAAVHHLC